MKPLSNPTDYLGGPSFKLRMHGPPPSNDTKVIDIEKPIGIIGDVAELTERAAKTLGEGKLEKIAGNTGTFTTGVSVAMHLLKNDTKGLFTDAGELIISRTPAAPYYYGAKLLNAIRNSKSVLAETYMGIYGNLMEWVDEMHSLPPDKQNEKNKEWLRYRRQANHYSDVLDQLGQKWLDLYGPETE